MCHCHCTESLDRILLDITQNTLFGCKVLLLSGDCRQIIPVIPSSSRAQLINKCVKYSFLYQSFKILRLTKIMRLRSLLQCSTRQQKLCNLLNVFCALVKDSFQLTIAIISTHLNISIKSITA